MFHSIFLLRESDYLAQKYTRFVPHFKATFLRDIFRSLPIFEHQVSFVNEQVHFEVPCLIIHFPQDAHKIDLKDRFPLFDTNQI